MSEHLQQAEIERLALVSEECAEVMQAIGKILRFGYNSRHPNGGPNNRQQLEREIGDLQARINLMMENDDINAWEVNSHCTAKMNSKDYLLYQD